MVSDQTKSIVTRAKAIYVDRLAEELEAKHRNRYVAIEPESADYFVADSYSEAVSASRRAHPERICFVIRIGHDAAIHLGGASL